MASLTGQSVASSYEQLLHVDRDGGGNTTTLVDIKDGDNGTTFALQLATDKINVNGAINSTINTTGVIGDLKNTHASGYGLKIQATDANSARYIATFNDKDDTMKARIFGDGGASFGGLVTMNRSQADESLSLSMYSTVDGHMPALLLKKSASNTVGTASATSSGDVLGQIVFQGHDTDNDVKAGALIRASADAAPDADSVPAIISF